MFRHHAHEKPMTETERETLLSEGAVIQGMVIRNEPSAADPRISQVRISVRLSGDQTAEGATTSQDRPALDRAHALPELRRPGRPGEGIPAPRPSVPVLSPAGPGEPGVVLSYS